MRRSSLSRRGFLERTGSCAAHLAIAAAISPAAARALWASLPGGPVVAREPFGRLERIAEGVWALISTPLTGDRTTLANGGIIAGRQGVLAIEGFFQPAGAEWLGRQARELTGHWPSHIALTHHHADHVNGITGYAIEGGVPVVRATERTRDAVLRPGQPTDEPRAAALRGAQLIPAGRESVLDLGGRVVRLVPRAGHTASDLTIELDDPGIVFCGDLVWNGMFPNYVDAVPDQLSAAVRALRRDRETIYVPGHGAVATGDDVTRYQAVLDEIERAARDANRSGLTAADAAAAFALPEALGEWTMFSRTFFERAFTAWYRVLAG